jgi:D-arabinose 1-dehydrogenase-like Zn-dependent alcohol dehydrogenase
LLRRIGARHIDSRRQDPEGPFDVIIETTGATAVAQEALAWLDEGGGMVLLGIPDGRARFLVGMRPMVLGNLAVAGSVNSSRIHFEGALEGLGEMGRRWPHVLDAVLTGHYRPDQAKAAFLDSGPATIKKVIDWI